MTTKPYEITQKNKTSAIVLIAVGLLSIIYGFASGHTERAWANLLLSNFYLMAIALGAVFFLAVQYVAEVGWSAQVKRILMAMGTYLPFATVFMILIFLIFPIQAEIFCKIFLEILLKVIKSNLELLKNKY